MAIKASCTVTLSCYRDTQKVTRYYKLQSSTSSVPSKPTTNPPSGWTETEPSYTSNSTNTLYFCDLTVFSDGTWSYSEVSKSSAYEAAKEAYNKANNAQSAADDAAKVATNYMGFSNSGLVIGDMTSTTLGRNIRIDSDSVDIRKGDVVLASYGEDYIYLGKNSQGAKIDLANGVGTLYNEDDSTFDFQRLVIEANHSIKLDTACAIYQNVYYDNGETSGSASIHVYTYEPWASQPEYIGGRIALYAEDVGTDNNAWSSLDLSGGTIELGVQSFITSQYSKIQLESVGGSVVLMGSTEITLDAPNTTTAGYLTLPNTYGLYGETSSGVQYNCVEVSNKDNIVYGYGGYEHSAGRTNIYGNKIYFITRDSDDVWWKPYYSKGDSVHIKWHGSGFVTNAKKNIYFTIPLTKPVIGSPTVTVTNVKGFTFRQNGSYTHGSTASTYVKAGSFVPTLEDSGCISIIATDFAAVTNCTNNSSIGMTADIKIVFS